MPSSADRRYQLDGFGDRFFRERIVGLELAVFYGAEVLGGFVAGSVKGKMRTVQSLSTKSYSLSIASVRIGDDYDSAQELLTFDPTDEQHHVPALLDTGSPCLMLPDTQVPFRHTDACV